MSSNENQQLTIEQLEQVGYSFVQFCKAEYPALKKTYHKDENIKKMMDLPSYCYTMFLFAVKSYVPTS
jgi:hypothetical protein